MLPAERALAHRALSESVTLDSERQESQGTQAWLALLGPMLSALDDGQAARHAQAGR